MKLRLQIEHIYCLYSFSFPLRGKIGISENPQRRRLEIESDLRRKFGDHVRVRRLISLPVITSAGAFESAIHRALRPLHCQTMRGTSGWSEWFWAFNPVVAILVWLFLWAHGNERATTAALFIFFVPVPLDFALYVACLAAVEYGAAFGVLWMFFR